MEKLELLRALDLGNSVAEFDTALEAYFVETETFRRLVADDADIVAGDKGTGKTALYSILQKRYTAFPALAEVEVVAAFNVRGNPVFQRLTEGEAGTEAEYQSLWKAYFFSLAGNWALALADGLEGERLDRLDGLLRATGLRSLDDSASTVFSKLVNLVRRLKSVTPAVAITPEGWPVFSVKADFETSEPEPTGDVLPHDEALGLLNAVLDGLGVTLWLVMDRLDEAFAGTPDAEIPALRALLRTYLDLSAYDRIRLKLFVRKDLFRRIIGDGFVNLTHVNARKIEIVWDEEALSDLLTRRLRQNSEFVGRANVGTEADALFHVLFPEKVDPGDRKPVTWRWMMSRIRDGNNVQPPRNLIDLVQKAQSVAIRREEREHNDYEAGQSLINADSLKRGLSALSETRVEDTLLAEAGARATLVERFRNGKAEHNDASLAEALGVSGAELEADVRFLREIGFLEPAGANYKIPMLYRDGLGIRQGKAFASGAGTDVEDDEDEM